MIWACLIALVIVAMARSFGASERVMTQAAYVAREPACTVFRDRRGPNAAHDRKFLARCQHLATNMKRHMVCCTLLSMEGKTRSLSQPRAASPITERRGQEPAQPSAPSPLPDMASDLDLMIDFSPHDNGSTQAHEDVFDSQAGVNFGSLDPLCTQAADNLSLVEFSMLPYFPEAVHSAPQPQHRRTPSDSTLRGTNPPSQGEANLDAVDLDREGRRTNHTPDRQAAVSILDSRPASVSRPYHKGRNISSLQRASPQTSRLSIEPLTSWMRRLSELNVELHQHMLSIPPTRPEHCGWKNQDIRRVPPNTRTMHQGQPLHIDRTLQLSQKYTEILTDALPLPRNRRGDDLHTPALRLDPASQLLVLSSFMCLVDSYDRILQNIREWVQLRLKKGSCIPDGCCLLPEIAIGAYRLPESSATRPLVLVCLIEIAAMQAHDAFSSLTKPVNGHASLRRGSAIDPTELESSVGATDSVLEISLQAILAREEATLDLIRGVWKLAIYCAKMWPDM